MLHDAFVDVVRVTFDTWKAARASGDGSALEKAGDQLVWLASKSVEIVGDEPSSDPARSALTATLGPVADEIEEVAEVLRRAGWK